MVNDGGIAIPPYVTVDFNLGKIKKEFWMITDLSNEEMAYKVYSKVASDFSGNIFFYSGIFIVLYFVVFKVLHWVLLAKIIVVLLSLVAILDIISTSITLITTISMFFIKEIKQHYFTILSTLIRLLGCVLYTSMCIFLIIKIF